MHSVLKDTYLDKKIFKQIILQFYISFGRTHVRLTIIKRGIGKHSNTSKVMIKTVGLVLCNDSTKLI